MIDSEQTGRTIASSCGGTARIKFSEHIRLLNGEVRYTGVQQFRRVQRNL